MTIRDLAREEIRDMHAYRGAAQLDGALRLHANESPQAIMRGADSLNRYPEIRPEALHCRLALHFGVPRDKILVTRGSSEAIDLLIRSFCRAGQDNVVITPPTFAMYRVYADIQGAGIIECPLVPEQDFAIDVDSLLEKCTATSKLIFICSPNNPCSNLVPETDVIRLLEARRGRTIVVVDEAYIEFSEGKSLAEQTKTIDNLVVLRTLSKAYALAGARCGAVIGAEPLIDLLERVASPYSFATPVVQRVANALGGGQLQNARRLIAEVVSQRDILREALRSIRHIEVVWQSQANFLLVRFQNLTKVSKYLAQQRIVIREFRDDAMLDNCARITVGSAEENQALVRALATLDVMQ